MGCYCSATPHPPCSYCESGIDYCLECEELHEDCECVVENFVEEEPDEVEKIIYEDTPEIIKERMREENTKIRIRNNRKSIRKTLGQ